MTDRCFTHAVDAGGQPVNFVVHDGRFVAIGADCTAALGKTDYGIAVGCNASFVAVRAPNAAAAVAGVPAERRVFRRGESDTGAPLAPALRFTR